MKMIADMASVIQTGMRTGFDAEAITIRNDAGKDEKFNTGGHAYENVVDYMLHMLEKYSLQPSDLIMVFEGRDSKKRRQQIAHTYKEDRDKSVPEYYVQYNLAKSLVKAAFLSIGAKAVTQDLAEGDDTCKYLAYVLDEPSVTVSNDGDLSAYVGFSPKGHRLSWTNGSDVDKLPDGVMRHEHITLYKALVGDSKDSVKGVPGFGKVAWDKLTVTYGLDGLNEISEALEGNDGNKIARYAKANGCNLLTKLVDNWNQARLCWLQVKIYPEWVNNRYYPLKVEAGICAAASDWERLSYRKDLPMRPDSRLLPYMQKKRLVTAVNFEESFALLQQRLAEEGPDYPISFDIETSTPEDSDDWMAQQGKADGVDTIGSFLVGFSITFGKGGKRTFYVSVNHFDTPNVTMSQARRMIELTFPHMKPIHNTMFELPVLYNAMDEDGSLWRDLWKDYGEFGFMPSIEDTLLMASYVDENAMQRSLKALSRTVLGYKQTEFNEMRTFRMAEGHRSELVGAGGYKPYPGGRVVEKTVQVPLMIDGIAQFTSAGKPRMQTVKDEVPVVVDGIPLMKRVRNKTTGKMEEVPKTEKVARKYKEVVYKMHEIPATVAFDYGCDDTICTLAYYNHAKFMMVLDEHYDVYRKVEIDPAYLHAKNFCDGFPLGIAELSAMQKDDFEIRENAERVLHRYLISKGWTGTVQPHYTVDISPAEVKEAYGTVFGLNEVDDDEEEDEELAVEEKDPVMSMRIRKMDKIVELIASQERNGAEAFAWHLEQLLKGEEGIFNDYVGKYFDGKPKFAYGSKDKCRLLYEVMGCEIRVRKDATPTMRKAGIREGNPSADTLAMDYAIADLTTAGRDEEAEVLSNLKLITMVNQRQGLFYNPYPNFVHWKTGKIHSSHRQCHANTRRASSAAPNTQQASAHEKIEGYSPRIRSAYKPHKRRAVIVAMDFNAQELRLMADDSQDPNMLACYVGDHKKDMHSITGSMIAFSKSEAMQKLREEFASLYDNDDDAIYYAFVSLAASDDPARLKLYKEFRGLGKKVNFTALYGAMAAKIAMTLMVSEADAQQFLDARSQAFRVSEEWKHQVIVAFAKKHGYVLSRMGARRHLAEMFDSGDRAISSKAERQAANFRIQGSAAEMTKMAEGRMWRAGLFTTKYDAVCIGPIHDEVVASVVIEELADFIKDMHACMVEPYADMKIEIKSSIDFGPNMLDTIDIGMEPTDEAIQKGIEKLRASFPELYGDFVAA